MYYSSLHLPELYIYTYTHTHKFSFKYVRRTLYGITDTFITRSVYNVYYSVLLKYSINYTIARKLINYNRFMFGKNTIGNKITNNIINSYV